MVTIPEADRSDPAVEAVTFRRLAGSLAHALNNRLFGLLGAVELYVLDTEDPTQRDRALELHRDASGLRTALRALGDVAREPFSPQELLVGESTRLTVERWRETANGLRVEVEIAEPDVYVSFTRRQLERILEELLDNAAWAAPASGSIRIEVGRNGGDATVVSVSDTGPGIDDHIRATLFEPFFTTRHDEGRLGLGLTAARIFALLHGGELRVASPEGTGARLELHIPPARPTAE